MEINGKKVKGSPLDYTLGDVVTISGLYRRRSLWQWLTHKQKELVVYTVTEIPTPGCCIKGE